MEVHLMTDMMSGVENVENSKPATSLDGLDERLVAQLLSSAKASGLKLTGEGGMLQQLTKLVLESALEGEITDHLGYDKHDPAGRGTGNSRNGTRAKIVLTDVGPVQIDVPARPGRQLRAQDRGQAAETPGRRGRDDDLPGREGPHDRRDLRAPGRGLWR
jgi:hypothetical protein